MKKTLILLIIFNIATAVAFAKEITVCGTVYSDSKLGGSQPLSKANITLAGTEFGMSTNMYGKFCIDVSDSSSLLKISSWGFITIEISARELIKSNKIYLEKDPNRISDIFVDNCIICGITAEELFKLKNDTISTNYDCIEIDWNDLQLNDSIIIGGYISECGEFGGYEEYILITNSDFKLKAEYIREPYPRCSDKYLIDPRSILDDYSEIKELTPSDIKILENYIKHFDFFWRKNNLSTAPTYYWIIQNGIKIRRYDPAGSWKYYESLRNYLFLN